MCGSEIVFLFMVKVSRSHSGCSIAQSISAFGHVRGGKSAQLCLRAGASSPCSMALSALTVLLSFGQVGNLISAYEATLFIPNIADYVTSKIITLGYNVSKI